MKSCLKRLSCERGATMLESVTILALVTVVAIPALSFQGRQVAATFQSVSLTPIDSDGDDGMVNPNFGGDTQSTQNDDYQNDPTITDNTGYKDGDGGGTPF